MKMYLRKKGYKKGSTNNIPNVIAFTMIRNFFSEKSYEEMRKDYFINNLNPKQVNKAMKDVKDLFKDYKGLDVVTMENPQGNITKFIL